ncbi:MAG: hypothetical protein HC842_02295 [Cytophagales bacterium]|nr:hypothetical protein [Cytophagales bacterium]
MPKFTLEELSAISGKLKFYHLLIDGVSLYDEFCKELERAGNQKGEIYTLLARMMEMAELRSMPEKKCKDITPKGDSTKEYELKTAHLRLYLIHEKNKGRVVVLMGKKTNQKRDIGRFRAIKKDYLKNKEHD